MRMGMLYRRFTFTMCRLLILSTWYGRYAWEGRTKL
jgi:hypothetical protein